MTLAAPTPQPSSPLGILTTRPARDAKSLWTIVAACQEYVHAVHLDVSLSATNTRSQDFDTPEYATYDAIPVRKWESNLGMDPFSYGYNRATPDDAYITPQRIVTTLIDIVSKNGNFLLDIGPQANGTIIEIEQRNLRLAGTWIKSHAEAIFNTTYWTITPEEGQAVRFTQTPDAFYITTLYAPNDSLVLTSPVPYVQGLDQVVVVGGNASGSVVPSELLADGSLILNISDEVRDADEYAWVFKIGYEWSNDTSGSGSGSGGAGGTTSGSVALQSMWTAAVAFVVGGLFTYVL